MEDRYDQVVGEDQSIDLMRYVKALVRKWWLIGLVLLVVTVPWGLYLMHQPPLYEADAWISFENITGPVSDDIIQSRILKLKSRTFAEEVTAELGLTLQLIQDKNLPLLERQHVFRAFSTSRTPVSGNYKLRFYPSGFCVFYFESNRLDSLRVEKCIDDTVSYNGLLFSLNPEIVKDRSEVAFAIKGFRGTVKSIISRLNIRTDATGNTMRIVFTDKNPILVSQTLNMLADIFVQKSIEMRKETSRFISNYLQEQLALAQENLTRSDYQLKSFRDKHLVGLDQETRQVVDRLDAVGGQLNRVTLSRDELSLLLNKLDPSASDFGTDVSAHYVYRQIAQQPIFQGNAAMTIAKQQLNDLDKKKSDFLERGFPDRNPQVVEVSENIQLIEEKIYRLAKDKLQELENQIAEMRQRMSEINKTINALPDEEMKFITLTRERRTNEDIYNLYLKRYSEAKISEEVVYQNVFIDPAVPPDKPVSGDKKKKAFIGMLLGFFLGVGFVLVLEEADKKIKTREDVRHYLKLPILGIIPKVKFDDYELQDSEKAKSISSQIVTHDYSPTPVGEAYRSLRTSLLFSKSIGPIRSLVIGSISPGEGKSFTAANLAITLAQQKSKTLLIDADLRRGVLHNSFNCPKKPGLTNYLTGVVSIENIFNETYIPNLSLITCGSLIPNPSELLGSIRMKQFIDGIIKRFDFVLFDTPPLLAATDAVILSTLVDGIAILIQAGKSNRESVKQKLELFHSVQTRVLGVILNCAGVEVAHEGYSYYRY